MHIIDTHNHFWKYNKSEFGWIDDSKKRIRQDFLPEMLEKEINQTGITGVISIQARQNIEETDWLLKLAGENNFIYGIVGWLPLIDPKNETLLEKYSSDPYLKGIRHVLHDEEDPDYILRKDFNMGIKLLKKFNLVYDILIFEKHLSQTISFVDQNPNQYFVLDHIAKPLIRLNILSPWKEQITELAKRENVYCKISGLVTEADTNNWTEEQLLVYMDVVIEAFGADRIMFGSDWPVCLVACEYKQWFDVVKNFIGKLSDNEQDKILFRNAIDIYNV